MIKWLDRGFRKRLARLFRGRFPGLYSTTDDPMQVPVQVAAYSLALESYIQRGDRLLDVGFGLGYGLEMLSQKAAYLAGIDVDQKAVAEAQRLVGAIPGLHELRAYDGQSIPYEQGSFDVVTCVDVIEHVPDYLGLLQEMLRVASRLVLVSTPNRRPENTLPNGRPRNIWHLREWSYEEFDLLLGRLPGIRIEWHFLEGPWEGPFQTGQVISDATLALTPVLLKVS
jgi:2-polyprenyl-3-methyl-5-hydroxy-6-metoxy-1,4-benzoquinol methylase